MCPKNGSKKTAGLKLIQSHTYIWFFTKIACEWDKHFINHSPCVAFIVYSHAWCWHTKYASSLDTLQLGRDNFVFFTLLFIKFNDLHDMFLSLFIQFFRVCEHTAIFWWRAQNCCVEIFNFTRRSTCVTWWVSCACLLWLKSIPWTLHCVCMANTFSIFLCTFVVILSFPLLSSFRSFRARWLCSNAFGPNCNWVCR